MVALLDLGISKRKNCGNLNLATLKDFSYRMVGTIMTGDNFHEKEERPKELCATRAEDEFMEVGEEKFFLRVNYEKYGKTVDKIEVRDDDVFIVGHPKTGTTWLHVMVYMLVHDLNYQLAPTILNYNYLFLDYPLVYDMPKMNGSYDFFDHFKSAPGPRCIRSHLSWPLLPEQIRNGTKKPKIIYIYRNPKDTCISLYHQYMQIGVFRAGLEIFCKLFMSGKVIYGPFFATLLSFWNQRGRDNVLMLNYKHLHADIKSTIRKISDFLGKSYTDLQIQELAEFVSFDSMKKNYERDMLAYMQTVSNSVDTKTSGTFFRKGVEGGYKTVMAPEMIQQFDKWTERNLAGTDLNFD